MKFIYSLVVFVLFSSNLFSQNSISIEGIVVDNSTSETLAYCNVVILNKKIGTITNEEGKFSFNNLSKKDTLVFSFVGYQDFIYSINSVKNISQIVIKLIPSSIVLDEIVISSKEFNVNKFMKEVSLNYQEKKRSTSHVAESYCKEKVKIGDAYVMFTESLGYSVFMESNNKISSLANYKYFSGQMRKSDRSKQWLEFSMDTYKDVFFGGGLGLNSFRRFELNSFLNNEKHNKFKYQLDSTYYNNDLLLYRVSFKGNKLKGTIDIYASDFKIKKIEYISKKIWSSPFHKKVKGKVQLFFRYYEDIAYVSRIDVNYKKGNLEYWSEMVVLNQKLGKLNFTMDEFWALNIFDFNPYVRYNEKLWENYLLKNDKDSKKIEIDLSKGGIELKKQFEKNSNNWFLGKKGNGTLIDIDKLAKKLKDHF